MSRIFQSVRFALRQLRKNPGFSIAAVLTLALGIGATTAIYSVVYATLFAPLPFGAVSFVLLTAALLASYLPARKAAHVDPMVALRYE